MQQPDPAEAAAVAKQFHLPALAVEDALNAHQRPKLEVDNGVLFVVLKPVSYVDHDEIVDVNQIALFSGSHFVITVRHSASDVLRRVRAELDAPGSVPQADRHRPCWVLYRATDLVVDEYKEIPRLLNEDMDEVELQVFDTEHHEDRSERIYKLKREVSEFRRAVVPLLDPMPRLAAR
jgi:magnesium transporter